MIGSHLHADEKNADRILLRIGRWGLREGCRGVQEGLDLGPRGRSMVEDTRDHYRALLRLEVWPYRNPNCKGNLTPAVILSMFSCLYSEHILETLCGLSQIHPRKSGIWPQQAPDSCRNRERVLLRSICDLQYNHNTIMVCDLTNDSMWGPPRRLPPNPPPSPTRKSHETSPTILWTIDVPEYDPTAIPIIPVCQFASFCQFASWVGWGTHYRGVGSKPAARLSRSKEPNRICPTATTDIDDPLFTSGSRGHLFRMRVRPRVGGPLFWPQGFGWIKDKFEEEGGHYLDDRCGPAGAAHYTSLLCPMGNSHDPNDSSCLWSVLQTVVSLICSPFVPEKKTSMGCLEGGTATKLLYSDKHNHRQCKCCFRNGSVSPPHRNVSFATLLYPHSEIAGAYVFGGLRLVYWTLRCVCTEDFDQLQMAVSFSQVSGFWKRQLKITWPGLLRWLVRGQNLWLNVCNNLLNLRPFRKKSQTKNWLPEK